MDTTSRVGDRVVRKTHWTLAADESKLTITSREPQADGSTKSETTEYIRSSESAGFTGAWTDPQRLASWPMLVLKMKKGSLYLAFPGTGQYANVKLDGSDSVLHGPMLPEGIALAIKPNGVDELLWTRKVNGTVINEGVLRLSKDGRTITQEYWSPKKPDQRAVLVYERQ